ncbi:MULTISPECIES: response regulator transcription factor [Sphingomonas]|jgi:FixJ family two-component response regulator|nr:MULTISPECIES: response regulator [Sphingomonas]MBA2920200.1 response regulator [Sphingomonas sp. CGMCC 1.13658]
MSDARRILLVDDDPAVRAALAFSLELDGFVVESFEDGEALARRPPHPDDACLVLDYRLPGMNGLALLGLLRSRGVRLPAVLITSNPTRSICKAVAEAGAELIEKPLLCDGLNRRIKALVAGAASAG